MRHALCVVCLLMMSLAGCSNPKAYFSLQEFGEGWQLKVVEKDKVFRASWVEGSNRSAKLVNYHDAPTGEFIVVNTLYLELDKAGKVVNGRLKRVATPEFSKRAYYERNAQWFRVLAGSCVLDKNGDGNVDIKCEGGFDFVGTVVPDDKMVKPKPE